MAKRRKKTTASRPRRKTAVRKRRNPTVLSRRKSVIRHRRRRNPATGGSDNLLQMVAGAFIGFMGGNILGNQVAPMISAQYKQYVSPLLKVGAGYGAHKFGSKFVSKPMAQGAALGLFLSTVTDLKKFAPSIPGLGTIEQLGGFGDEVSPVFGELTMNQDQPEVGEVVDINGYFGEVEEASVSF